MLAQPGCRIRNRRALDYPSPGAVFEGTLGCFVERAGEAGRYFLSSAHVLALNGLASVGDVIEYLDTDTGTWTPFAHLEDWSRYQGLDGVHGLDAALAKVTREDLVSSRILGTEIIPVPATQAAVAGARVGFAGAGGGLVEGLDIQGVGVQTSLVFSGFNGAPPAVLRFSQQIILGRKGADGAWRGVAKAGDLGSLVYDAFHFAVGLLTGSIAAEGALDVCTPLATILRHFSVRLPVPPAAASGAVPPASPVDLANRVIDASSRVLGESVWSLFQAHRVYQDSVSWMMTPRGLEVEGKLERTAGKPVTVERVWMNYGTQIAACAEKHRVPAELIVATICTESSGNPRSLRREPGWVSDAQTKNKVSAGLMQTLLSTAEEALGRSGMSVDDLFDPATSIDAGTAYISQQRQRTRLDPPQVACAYNAGAVYENTGAANRWKMRQYPIGSSYHADRFVSWFNDCMGYFQSLQDQGGPVPAVSFFAITRT